MSDPLLRRLDTDSYRDAAASTDAPHRQAIEELCEEIEVMRMRIADVAAAVLMGMDSANAFRCLRAILQAPGDDKGGEEESGAMASAAPRPH